MKLNLFSSIILLMGFISACECDEMTPTKPERDIFNQAFSVSESGIYATDTTRNEYYVFFDFSHEIDPRTAKININIILHGFEATSDITINGSQLFFYAKRVDCQKCVPGLTLKGEGTFPLKSIKGYFLDGNKDGLPGGDYILEMR